ncbi:LysR family transcriptional regulator [Peptoniphilus sp. AGMB00490]|uniref:LysR family transcriptional regulator n=1 Tax=Peptoniphilus faecalis TaxID=2731255 RepID=A0A848RIP4_9FIRM|nr:LysR family transcriptional regulator [Peptoniphilus faecalis]NMW85681.1 LysR family transcriptional regulator [Peptoniphilus faecalis]
MLDKKQIKYLSVLIKYKNISKASEVLFTSQPSLSRYLKMIESELGFQIFDRSSSPFKLTKEGEIYSKYLEMFIDLDSKMHNEIRAIDDKKEEIRISSLPFLSSYIYPNFIPIFIDNNPNITLNITDYNEKNNEYLILNNLIDIFITNSKPKHKNLLYKFVNKDNIYIICKSNNAINFKYNLKNNSIKNPIPIDFEDFRNKTFYLVDPLENIGKISKDILIQNNFTPKSIKYVPNILSSVSMLDQSSATFITESSLFYVPIKKDIVFFKVKNYQDLMSIGFIYHKDFNAELINKFYYSMVMALSNKIV